MKKFLELSSWNRKAIVSIFIAAMLFAACGDDDSSFAPQDEDSSSSACEECDESSSSSKDDVQSGDSHDSSARTSTGSSSTSKSSSSSSKDVMSSSSAKSSSSVAYVEPCRADSVDTCEYGTLTDARDGQTYKTVTIGSQTWMAQNLNYAYTGVPYKYDVYSSDSTSWCNNDDASNCAKYGRLYTWAVAMDSVGLWSSNGKGCGTSKTCSPTYPVRGVCPEGWHLPTQEEWRALFTAVGGKAFAGERLKTTSGWSWDEEHNISGNGTDAYAFSALPVAGRDDRGYYGDYAYNTRIWSSNENDRFYADCLFLGYEYSNAFLSTTRKYYGYPVRCLKDEGDVPASSGSTAKSSSSLAKSSSSSVSGSSEASSSSSADVLSSSSKGLDWSLPKEAYLNPEIEYDTIIDSRDGKVYRTVKIGNQTWMAENLNFDPGQGGSGDAKYEWSWCYDNEPRNCDVAGRLYTWAAAIDSVKLANDAENPQECGYGKNCNLPAKVQGVCPPDWHLPTQAEWNTLFLSVGGQYQSTAGKALKSQSGWFVINSGNYFFNGNGTDEFGFCALPVGWEDREGFHDASHFAEFWSSTEDTDRDWAYNACVKNYEDEAYVDLPTRKDVGTSVRCVKD